MSHFRPTPGFARAWAELARAAGCRYVVFTTKHHEGFCLFKSQYTTYDRPDWGRYTKKAGKLYAHVFEWPRDGVLQVPVPASQVQRVYWLADQGRKGLKTESRSNGIAVHLPEKARTATVPVMAIALQE